jgi:Uma2 family endonuclease
MGAIAEIPVRMTVAEFLARDAGDGRLWQLVDGEPQAMAPASRTHGAIQAELCRLFANHLAERSSLCSVLANPGVVPRVQAEHNVRIPDLAVICSEYESEEPVIADPVLIVEILSPSNEAETSANVWAYTTIPSVREIVVLRAVSIGADLLRRRPDGFWPRTPEAIDAGDLLGAVAQTLAGTEADTERRKADETARLEAEIAAYREALQKLSRARAARMGRDADESRQYARSAWRAGERDGAAGGGHRRLSRSLAGTYPHARGAQWAMSTGNQGVALMPLAERRRDLEMAKLAVQQIEAAFTASRGGGDAPSAAIFEAQLPKARALAQKLAQR